jgi:hypothetical protein
MVGLSRQRHDYLGPVSTSGSLLRHDVMKEEEMRLLMFPVEVGVEQASPFQDKLVNPTKASLAGATTSPQETIAFHNLPRLHLSSSCNSRRESHYLGKAPGRCAILGQSRVFTSTHNLLQPPLHRNPSRRQRIP